MNEKRFYDHELTEINLDGVEPTNPALSDLNTEKAFRDRQGLVLNNHRLEVGGLGLRTESPAVPAGCAAGLFNIETIARTRLKMMRKVAGDHLFRHFTDTVTQKYPRAQKC